MDTAITDILQSDHAWVLATVAPGEYLALETTGGYVVKKSENPLYYRGWSFNSPADLKSHNDMVKEYNTRVGFRNQLNTEANKALPSITLPPTRPMRTNTRPYMTSWWSSVPRRKRP